MIRAFGLRFALLLFCALVPLGLFAYLNAPASRNLGEIARHTANEGDRLLQWRMQQAFTFAAFPSIRAFAASTPAARSERASVALNELKALVAADKNVREALILDANGSVIMTTLDGWGGSLAQRQFVQDALQGRLAVSPVSRDRGENSTYYAAPVLNNAGEVAGAFVMRVAAQEFWSVMSRGEDWYAVWSDENAVRLDDTGDPARRIMSFGTIDAARATIIAQTLQYGAELPLVRGTNLERAQALLTRGALDELRPSDLDATAIASQRLVSKPWTVLVLARSSLFPEDYSRYALPLIAAIFVSLGGALLLARI